MKIFAWRMENILRCDSCGTRREEWDDDKDAYFVDDSRCIGCEKIAWANHSWSEEPTGAYGVKFRLVKAKDLQPTRIVTSE